MTLPHFNPTTNTIMSMYINTGTYCTFIDSDDTNYDDISTSVCKLTNNYFLVYMNTINDELLLIEQIFKLINNKPTMVVNYGSSSEVTKIIGEIWFKGFNVTHIENLFEFDTEFISEPESINGSLRQVKLYYEYDSIEYMKTDDITIRKNKLNKLMNKEGSRYIIDSKMIK